MTNHTHLIVVPNDAAALSRAVGEAHRRYTRMKNFSEDVRGYLFQGRFGSCVLDERHLLAAARYVELNPVTAGMVGSLRSGTISGFASKRKSEGLAITQSSCG
jgi:putative transposase